MSSLLTTGQPIIVGQAPASQAPTPAITPSTTNSQTARTGEPGPWGRLLTYPVFLEAAPIVLEKFALPNSRPRWAFAAAMKPQLGDLFKSAGLDQDFIDAMLNPSSIVEADGNVFVFPPLPRLEAMTAAQRQVVYAELRKLEVNEFHFEPVLITSGTVEEWFRDSDVRPELIQLIKQMSYMRGETIAFSDMAALMNHVTGEQEARVVLKACTRTRALMVKLLLDKTSDIQGIIDYWTTGLNLRKKDIEPLLRSVVETAGVDGIDVLHIIPPLPRKLALSYPDSGLMKDGIMPDCHWTSLNFFNYDPHPYLLDSRLATSAVLERFVPVNDQYRYGDILFFMSKNGDAFHSCVYLADNVAFTKNGRNVLSPWAFMSLNDLKKIYLYDDNGRIQAYRSKQSPYLPAKKK